MKKNTKIIFEIDKTNSNCLILKQIINNKEVVHYVAIPRGRNRTDILTNDVIKYCQYDIDAIIIIISENERNFYYDNKLQLTQKF